MPLRCKLFARDRALEACSTQDSAQITMGAKGDHVSKIHMALLILDDNSVAPAEVRTQTYGASTAAAVLVFKKRRSTINRAYQNNPDGIVGKMTIAAIDREMLTAENMPPTPRDLSGDIAASSRRHF